MMADQENNEPKKSNFQGFGSMYLYGGAFGSPEQIIIAEKEFIEERLKILNQLTKQITFTRQVALDSVSELRNFQNSRMKTEINKSDADRVKEFFDKAVKNSELESESIRLALDLIHEIREYTSSSRKKQYNYFPLKKQVYRRGHMIKLLNECAHTLPLWVGKTVTEKAPSLCGAIGADMDYSPKIGDLVAALIPNAHDIIKPTSLSHMQNPNHEGDWILAEVVHVNSKTFEVEDIDEEQNERHCLSRRSIIPLPLYRANPETNPEALFKRDTECLALYPQTTCFYKGKVLNPPISANGMYRILFVDSTYQDGYSPPLDVPQRYVVKFPEDAVLEQPKKRSRDFDPEAINDPKRFIPFTSSHKPKKSE